MKLSTLYTAVPEYIEVGWVTAPNEAAQTVAAETVALLTINSEIQDTGNLVSAPSANLLTIPAGTYYFEAEADILPTGDVYGGTDAAIFSLWNNTDAAYITRQRKFANTTSPDAVPYRLNGQFVITSSKAIGLRVLTSSGCEIGKAPNSSYTTSTAGADQRTTLKLWKLK